MLETVPVTVACTPGCSQATGISCPYWSQSYGSSRRRSRTVRMPIFWRPARYVLLMVTPSADTGESRVTEAATATPIGSGIVALRPAPPLTQVTDVVEVLHGFEVHDPYRWLEDESAPEVRDWVAAQQAYARAYLDALPERPAIEARLREVMDVGALGPSGPHGRYRFFLRRAPGANQACLWVD